jgi:hypothetical protein
MLKSKETASSGPSGAGDASILLSASRPSLDPFQAATYGGGGMAFNQFANMQQAAFDMPQMQMQQQIFMP